MAKLLSRPRLVTYMPGLRYLQAAVLNRKLANSSASRQFSNSGDITDSETEGLPHTVLPDQTLGPLAPRDPRFPLPGNVGPASLLKPSSATSPVAFHKSLPEVLTKASPAERHSIVLAQFLNSAAEADEEAELQEVTKALQDHPSALECVAQDCPDLLRKSFLDLFPGSISLKVQDRMTVMTLCQKTNNDMTSWNADVDTEREELLEVFINSAEEICKLLSKAGFWADFIDPSSGQAYLGDSNPNTSLFETDERFMQLGFEIEDLGCCKCIRHSVWGTHVFVGAIFTTAPPDCDIMTDIMLNKEISI